MKTEENEAFDDLAKKQGAWGGGFKAKQAMAADKFIAAEERKVGERYGYVPKLHPSEWISEPAQPQQDESDLLTIAYQSGFYDGKKATLAQPLQKPVAYVTGMSFGRFIVEPLNPAMVLPVGMALYSSPQGNT